MARSFKDAVNSALYRTTGYMFTRETPEQRQQAIRQAAQRARERTATKYERLAAQQEARRKKRAAQRRAEAEARRAEAAARRQELAAQRRAEAQARRAEAAARREAERQQKREAERQRREAERQRRQAEREQQREAERQRIEAERQRKEVEAQRKEAERQQKQAEQQAEQERLAEERAARIARGDDLPTRFFDADMRRTIARVRPRTMTGHRKLQALIEATRYLVREQIPGEIVECGVWRGGSMQAVALTLLEQGDTTRELHLFDTFEGMPPPTEHDSRTTYGETVSAQELLATSDKDSWMWAIADLDDVQRGMSEVDYPADKVHYHQGLVEDTTPGQAPERIALLRLDTDWYASTLHELEVLYDRLSPGGVLIIDDYGEWDGARKATEEWLAKLGHPLFLATMEDGRIATKPLNRQHGPT